MMTYDSVIDGRGIDGIYFSRRSWLFFGQPRIVESVVKGMGRKREEEEEKAYRKRPVSLKPRKILIFVCFYYDMHISSMLISFVSNIANKCTDVSVVGGGW